MIRSEYDIIIAGGGASGLMLAASIDLQGRAGAVLEKTASLGTKLLMSGGGRCNITHGGSVKDFISAYGEAGPRLRKCLYRHSNLELMKWLEENGMPVRDEKGRVFPASMKAADILELLLRKARENGWEIVTGTEVLDISSAAPCEDPGSGGVSTCCSVNVSPGGNLTAKSAVLATGGITFPETGSDGSALEMLRDKGVRITDRRSALAPVYVKDYPYEDLAGISLEGVTVTVFSSDAVMTCKGKAAAMTGDLLFTHRGFSGPVILNISRYAETGERIRLSYNRSFDDLPRRMQRALASRAKGPSGDVRTSVLAALLDADDFVVSSVDENGMVTAGGISLDDIDTQTMELRNLPGIYAVGEAIDADGITGGYNLQLCWSTARTAADALSRI